MPRKDFMYIKHIGGNRIATCGYQGLFLEYDERTDVFKNIMPEDFPKMLYKETIGISASRQGRTETRIKRH